MSHFGKLVKKLRLEKGLTQETVAKKIGSHKGYISGIENGKVNPPSEKVIRKYAKLLDQQPRALVLIAWIDKAPKIVKEDVEKLLHTSG